MNVAEKDGRDWPFKEEQGEEGEKQEDGGNNLSVALQEVCDLSKAPGDAALRHDHPIDVLGNEFVELFVFNVCVSVCVSTKNVQVLLIFPQDGDLGQVLVVQVHLEGHG